jgi:hypothetical protein
MQNQIFKAVTLTSFALVSVGARAFSIEVDAFSGSEKVITFSPGFAYTEAPSVTYEGVKFESKGSGSGTIGSHGNWLSLTELPRTAEDVVA